MRRRDGMARAPFPALLAVAAVLSACGVVCVEGQPDPAAIPDGPVAAGGVT